MNGYKEYLNRITKGLYLHRQEKANFVEEMCNHLEEAASHFRLSGMDENEAREKALLSFGRPKELRKRIIRETFGVSPQWYLAGAILCAIALILALYTNMRFDDVIVTRRSPTTWVTMANPQWVVWLHRYLPLNPNRWIVLGTMFFMMLFTRNWTDRLGVAVSPLAVFWMLVPRSMTFPNFLGNPYRLMFPGFFNFARLDLGTIYHYGFVAALSVVLLLWTRNRLVSLTPWFASLNLAVVLHGWHALQYTLWTSTQNPIFWGQSPFGFMGYLTTLEILLVHILGATVVLRLYHRMDSRRNRQISTT